MQAKKRYLIVIGTALTVCGIVFLFSPNHSQRSQNVGIEPLKARSYLDDTDISSEQDLQVSARQRRDTSNSEFNSRRDCRMETCFDFSLCKNGFKVYVYPLQERVSEKYNEILTAVKTSRYYTPDPSLACIFILSIDTLDRDTLSTEFVKNVQQKVEKLEYWRNGLNHIIFNLYSGTWPDYDENDLGFDIGKAMLAKASISQNNYRPGFDISLPLFHKEHAAKGGERGTLQGNNIPPQQKYTLVFKGKRYLAGIGSETRNSLYHIHNNMDIIMLTTCKHGRDWKRMSDERCEHDNREYDRFDYKTLLNNSTFCLVPRGRRLGSFRFLEALKAACIPVLLSNGWVLPFSEVIDWNRAAIWGDERLLLQIPSIVRSVSQAEILGLRQQSQFLWDAYFSSIENMIDTLLEIVTDRVAVGLSRTGFVWNTLPGAVTMLPEFSDALADYPFYTSQLGVPPPTHFTAVLYATSTSVITNPTFSKLVKYLGKSKHLHKIVVLWHCETVPTLDNRWPIARRVPVIFKQIKSLSERFYPHSEISTAAVLSLDADSLLATDEMDFAFSVWRNFPERIVGYPARNHFWEESRSRWGYTSKWTNAYSMVLTGAAFYHRYYHDLYSTLLHDDLRQLVDTSNNCEDILFNFLVSHVTKSPPIKVGQRKHFKEVATPSVDHFNQRQMCIDMFVNSFGTMPLLRSNLRLDPVLFKDPVSISRKKYRQMELV